jgi:precorrin-6B methylase 1
VLVLKEAIEAAEVLVGGKRQLAVFAGQSERTWILGANPATTLEAVKQEAGGKRVVILASGDPLFFGIGNLGNRFVSSQCYRPAKNICSTQIAVERSPNR